jgi:hypothetical protein
VGRREGADEAAEGPAASWGDVDADQRGTFTTYIESLLGRAHIVS